MSKPPSRDAIKRHIRDAGLRATAGRVAVYQRLVEATAPLRHADLVEALNDVGVDQATVYRNLMDLTRAGLVTRTDLGDHAWRFELKEGSHAGREGHPHFVCIDCGEVSCLDDVTVTLQGDGLPTGALEVQLRGHCHACEGV